METELNSSRIKDGEAENRYGEIIIASPQAVHPDPVNTKRRWRWRIFSLLVVAATVVVAGIGCWNIVPEYYSRWRQVQQLMERVTADRYHELHGGSFVIRRGMSIGGSRLFQKLSEFGYRLDDMAGVPGSYRLDDALLTIFPYGKGVDKQYDLLIEDGSVKRIVPSSSRHGIAEIHIGRPLLTSFLESIWELREVVPAESFPDLLIEAVLTAEDGRFYTHPGIDVRGMGRAALVNARKGTISQGGSTITQQVIKTLINRTERTYWEKAFEACLALHLELVYGKEAIMAAYLNNVYMGHIGPFALYGLPAAAKYLLGKQVEELSPGECAVLAGMIKSPNTLSPLKQPVQSIAHAARILRMMKERGVVEPEYIYLPPDDLQVSGSQARERLLALAWIWQELERELRNNRLIFSATGEQAVVEISVDPAMQQEVVALLAGRLNELELKRKKPVSLQGAVAVIDQHNGGIRAMTGGRNFLQSQFNRASMAQRSVGSLIKPFVYLAAMRADTPGGPIYPLTQVSDTPMRVTTKSGQWRPANYDKKYHGTVTIEDALVRSLNIPAVRIGQRATLARVAELVQEVGISDKPTMYPSLFLGACSSNVMRVAAAYSALARDGEYVAPQLIDRVTVAGSVVFSRRPEPIRVLDEEDSRVMTAMLQKVLVSGTGKTARRYDLGSEIAGKTGTSSDLRDSWFAGYTPELTTVVWVGNDDNKPIGLSGAEAALPVWSDIMDRFGRGSVAEFSEPLRKYDAMSTSVQIAAEFGAPHTIHGVRPIKPGPSESILRVAEKNKVKEKTPSKQSKAAVQSLKTQKYKYFN